MEQIGKQHNAFIVSLAGQNIDTTIVNIEEMQGYVKERKRFAVIGTEKRTYGELDRMSYQFVMNYTKPKIFALDSKKKPSLNVYTYLLEKFRSGLIIIESDTLSDPISELICNSEQLSKNDIDIMICRNGFEDMTDGERRKANYLRIHANPDMNPAIFEKLGEFYQEKVTALMISQFFVNCQYEEVNTYFEKHNEIYAKQGLKDFVDYSQLNKQLAYFIYYDVANNKILNLSKDILEDFIKKMKAQGLMPMPDEEIPVLAEMLTNE